MNLIILTMQPKLKLRNLLNRRVKSATSPSGQSAHEMRRSRLDRAHGPPPGPAEDQHTTRPPRHGPSAVGPPLGMLRGARTRDLQAGWRLRLFSCGPPPSCVEIHGACSRGLCYNIIYAETKKADQSFGLEKESATSAVQSSEEGPAEGEQHHQGNHCEAEATAEAISAKESAAAGAGTKAAKCPGEAQSSN